MKKKVITALFTISITISIVGLLSIPRSANAAMININARTNTTTNPIVEFFTAGSYEVIPVGVSDGGAYNAWNAWGHVILPSDGWLNTYSLSSIEFNAYTVGDNVRYATDLLALNNAVSTFFTLTSDGNVNFFIRDNPYYDNIGGISLSVNSVPIPVSIWLLCSGMIGLIGLRKKFSI